MEQIAFTVLERSQSQGAISGRHHRNKKLVPFRERVGWEALRARVAAGVHDPAPKDVPVMVELGLYFERPKGVPATALFPVHVHIPDIDHSARGILDSLAGVLYENDRQVVDCQAVKLYGSPARCEVRVRFAATEAAK